MKTVLGKMWLQAVQETAEVKEAQGKDKKEGGEKKKKYKLCTYCLGTGQLFVSFGHCLSEEGGQTTEQGEGLGGVCVQKKNKATGHVCTDILVMGFCGVVSTVKLTTQMKLERSLYVFLGRGCVWRES